MTQAKDIKPGAKALPPEAVASPHPVTPAACHPSPPRGEGHGEAGDHG